MVKFVLQRGGKSDKTVAKTSAVKTKAANEKAVWDEMFLITYALVVKRMESLLILCSD